MTRIKMVMMIKKDSIHIFLFRHKVVSSEHPQSSTVIILGRVSPLVCLSDDNFRES